ncbi:hypothetical protein C5167_000459 [Papaver somniferum]|uniref:Uncharacterized protein n=1 Tax=Papaver somniferum TaxID=3469 RepID=A0A4Y7KW31_PAPSO|nr:hypothetical protein C5167_000459 [Papaver somniferum]
MGGVLARHWKGKMNLNSLEQHSTYTGRNQKNLPWKWALNAKHYEACGGVRSNYNILISYLRLPVYLPVLQAWNLSGWRLCHQEPLQQNFV